MQLLKKVFGIYKVQFLASLTLFVMLLTLLGIRNPLDISMVLFGCLVGTFVLDLDYIIYAFFTDPNEDFSLTLKGYLKHKDYINAISYVFYHKDDIRQKTLHSVLFQIVLGGLTFFMVFTPLNLFTKALIISAYTNSLYRMGENLMEDRALEWFWLLKEPPSKKWIKFYLIGSVLVLLVGLQFI